MRFSYGSNRLPPTCDETKTIGCRKLQQLTLSRSPSQLVAGPRFFKVTHHGLARIGPMSLVSPYPTNGSMVVCLLWSNPAHHHIPGNREPCTTRCRRTPYSSSTHCNSMSRAKRTAHLFAEHCPRHPQSLVPRVQDSLHVPKSSSNTPCTLAYRCIYSVLSVLSLLPYPIHLLSPPQNQTIPPHHPPHPLANNRTKPPSPVLYTHPPYPFASQPNSSQQRRISRHLRRGRVGMLVAASSSLAR